MGKYLRISEASQLTGWAVPTLYSKVSRGGLPALKIGGSLRFRRADLLSLFRVRPSRRTPPRGGA